MVTRLREGDAAGGVTVRVHPPSENDSAPHTNQAAGTTQQALAERGQQRHLLHVCWLHFIHPHHSDRKT